MPKLTFRINYRTTVVQTLQSREFISFHHWTTEYFPGEEHQPSLSFKTSSALQAVFTCACGSFENGRTCKSSPNTATRCPCLGSAVSRPSEPCRLLLLPPCCAAHTLLPAGSCIQRWTCWRAQGGASAGQPYSWGNLSWRPIGRAQEKGGRWAEEATEPRKGQ